MREIPSCAKSLQDSLGTLNYQTYGSTGPWVLLIDGLLGGPELWQPLMGHFCDRYRFLAWTARGLGIDEQFAQAPREHARDAASILEAEGITQSAVLASALGVQVALELFRYAPERVKLLALLGGGAHLRTSETSEGKLQNGLIRLAVRGLGKLPEGALQRGLAVLQLPESYLWARRFGLLGGKADPELFAGLLRRVAKRKVSRLVETLALAQAHDASDILPRVSVPTLVVAAGRDPFTSRAALEELVSEIPQAEYLMLTDAGHFAALDHSDHVNLRMEKFFAEHDYR